LNEGVPEENIIVTGNSVIDALQLISARPPTPEVQHLLKSLGIPDQPYDPIPENSPPPRLVLITAHRRENFGQPLENICQAIYTLAEIYRESVRFVYPVHLNPNVQEPVYRILGEVPNVTLLQPMDYLPLVHLMKRTTLILTDSGGIQEEAPSLGVPVLVLREVTERPEGVQTGTVRLVGTDTNRIVSEARRLLDDPSEHERMAHAVNPYGDGHAARRIVQAILDYDPTGQRKTGASNGS